MSYKTVKVVHSTPEKEGEQVLGCLILLGLSLLLAPGMVVVAILGGESLALSQRWTFAIIVDAAIVAFLGILFDAAGLSGHRLVRQIWTLYSILTAATIVVYAVAHWGFLAVWPAEHLQQFFP